MRVIFLGRKPAASAALESLVRRGAEVVAVVAPMEADPAPHWRPLLQDTAAQLGLPVVRDEELYAALALPGDQPGPRLERIDLVISFLFWRRIRGPLIQLPALGCFNFHPAPLPMFRGRRGYNFAILEGEPEYGASAHWVSEGFDEGDLVEVRTFPIIEGETALSLERRTMGVMLDMFDDFIDLVASGRPIPRTPQGNGRSATKVELLAAMEVLPTDTAEVVARKARAFWYPPHHGAHITIGGRTFTLVDDEILEQLGRKYHDGSHDS